MKPLTPEEQFQMQLDVENLKVMVKELSEQVLLISDSLPSVKSGLLAVNETVTAHHTLLKDIVGKLVSK